MVLDLVLQPASFVSCEDSISLQVSSGSDAAVSQFTTVATSDSATDTDSATGTLVQLARTARVQEYRTEAHQDSRLCWVRAVCAECGLPAVARVDAVAHWSAQAIGWRFATKDA